MKAQRIIPKTIFTIGLFAAVLIISDRDRPDVYKYLWVLPLVFSIFIILIDCVYKIDEIKCAIMISLFSMRNIVTPIIMRYGKYSSYFPVSSQDNVNNAILLMLYESIIVITYGVYLSNKIETNQLNFQYSKARIKVKSQINPPTIGIVFALFLLLIFVTNPGFFKGYTSFFSGGNIRDISPAESSSAIQTLFGVFFPIIYTFFGVYLIMISSALVHFQPLRKLLCIIAVCIPLLFMNNSDAFSLICVLSLAIVALRTNGLDKKIFFAVIGGGTMIAAIYILLSAANLSFSSATKTTMQKLSDLFVAYFPGVPNVAGFFNMKDHDKLQTLFYDFYVTIPYRNSVFGLTTDYRLVKYLCADNFTNSQVMPCIVQLTYYFGIFGAFIECLFIRFAFRVYGKMGNEKNAFMLFAHSMLFIYLMLTPVSYNYTNVMARVNITIIPMLIIFSFIKDKRFISIVNDNND